MIARQPPQADYMKTIIRGKIEGNSKGFTLIELMVAIFIFSVIMAGLLSVSVSILNAYQKARAVKTVKESADFALSSIAKDVRMGKIESPFTVGEIEHPTDDGTNYNKYFAITRNRNRRVACYYLTSNYLGVANGESGSVESPVSASCPADSGDNYIKIIDLTDTGMSFDTDSSGFYSMPTDTEIVDTLEKNRGWMEINLNIKADADREMEVDQVNVQTVVSSRDYGWEEVP